jgi:signal transduction histidine kinase/DNA-binding response OmpR family regulator
MQGMLIRLFVVFYCAFIIPSTAYSNDALLSKFEQPQSFDNKLELAQRLLNEATTTDTQKVAIYSSLADLAFEEGRYTNAVINFKALEDITSDTFLPEQHFRAIKMQGVVLYYQGEFQQAIIEYTRAKAIADNNAQQIEQANLLSNIGLAYFQMSNMELTLENYLNAKEIYQVKGSKQDQADILLNIAGVYIRLSRHDDALTIYREVLNVYRTLKDESGIAQVYNNIGVVYYETNKFDLSLHYYQLALRFYLSTKNYNKLSTQYNNLATTNLILNKIDVAEKQAQLALMYALKISNHSLELAALQSLAKIQFLQGDLTQAATNLERSIELAREYKNERLSIDGLGLQGLIQAGIGDYSKAMDSHKRFEDEQKRLRSEETTKALALLQNEFKATQLHQEIEQLKQDQRVQSLKMTQRSQLTTLIFLLFILVVVSGIAIYRRNTEKHAKHQLAEQVEQRTQELQTVAQELRNANEVKSQFLANISHEIRTPLTAILGQTDDLMNGLYNPEQLQNELQVIQRQGQHLKSLINDVLDISKIEANRLELNISRFDLVQLINDMYIMFLPQAKAKGLELVLENKIGERFYTNLDLIRVKQILINLFANAIKFTHKGRVALIVNNTEHGIVCTIQDTGIGMSNEQLKLIFEYFRQADNSISRRFGGTGLGLSLSQQLATMMGGYISVQSEYKNGSQFSFYVPCVKLSEQTKDIEKEEHKTSNKQLVGKVLLAEDHDDNRRLISRYLRSLGLTVIAVENGEQAVELCLKEYPDLVLLDIQMPIMDGISALKLLKDCAYQQPIFALTANAMSHEIDHYLSLGFTGYLAKPIDKDAFYNALSQHLNTSKVESEYKHIDVDMSDLIESFKQSFPIEYEAISLHLEKEEYITLQKDAHRVLGAAQMFGFEDIANAANLLDRELQQFKGREDSANINELAIKLLTVLKKYN